MFVVRCSCGFGCDSAAGSESEALAAMTKDHVHPGAAFTAKPMDYSAHELYARYIP